jgi:hypothetical protein
MGSAGTTPLKVKRMGRRVELVYECEEIVVATEIFESHQMITKEGSIPEGPVVEYYRDGKVKRTMAYQNGKPKGQSHIFYSTGELCEEQLFANGKLEGRSVMYRRDGRVWRESSYRRGKLHGEVTVYHDNGQIETRSHHEKGKLHGSYECYDEMGFLGEGANMVTNANSAMHLLNLHSVHPSAMVTVEGNEIEQETLAGVRRFKVPEIIHRPERSGSRGCH